MAAGRFSVLVAAVVLLSGQTVAAAVSHGSPARKAAAQGKTLVSLHERLPWYHSADELHGALASLAGNCHGADLELSNMSSPDGAVTLDTVHIRRGGGGNDAQGKKTKALFFFGIHSRELISTESGLHFAQTLCGKGPLAKRADSLLNEVDVTIVPNANPFGRKKVEAGNFCKRTNEHDVDLNRNWGFDGHMDPEEKGADTNPGPHSFSEPESILLRQFVQTEKPDIFLDVHSGSYLLGTPWAYSPKAYPKDASMLLEVLKPISEKYCKGECPYGNAADLVGYPAPGTEMDFVKEIGTPYSFSWEIYVGPRFRQHFIKKAQEQREKAGEGESSASLLQTDDREILESLVDATQSVDDAAEEARSLRGTLTESSASALKSKSSLQTQPLQTQLRASLQTQLRASQKDEQCIEQFSPETKEETQEVVENWSDAYLDLIERVLAHKSRGS